MDISIWNLIGILLRYDEVGTHAFGQGAGPTEPHQSGAILREEFECLLPTDRFRRRELLRTAAGTRAGHQGFDPEPWIDRGDHRPGMIAAQEHSVRSPLIEAGLNKLEVRQLAEHWGITIWDKPATPCLSSRIAYGEEVTSERVAMIDAAEQFLRSQGLRELRVRYHAGDVARIEVPIDLLESLCRQGVRDELVRTFRQLGFKLVTLDLEGFRSGSLNTLIPSESLRLVK